MDVGVTFDTVCEADGSYVTPSGAGTTCRAAAPCTATLPVPPDNKNLKRSTSSVPREHDVAVYKCKPGFTFKGTAAADRADTTDSDEFHLPCLSTGQFDASPNWPTCTPRCQTYLDAPPAMVTLEPVLPIAYVSPGDKAQYKCSNDDYVVNDNQQFFEVTCGTDGNFIPVKCAAPPSSFGAGISDQSTSVRDILLSR